MLVPVNGPRSGDLTRVAALAIDLQSQLSHCAQPILRCDFPPAASTTLPRTKFPRKIRTVKNPRKRSVFKGFLFGCAGKI